MSLKNIILKSIATTMAVSIVFGNVTICGIGISEVIAESIENETETITEAEVENNIYKGFLYSNVQNKTNYDTEFKSVSTLSVQEDDMNEQIIEIKEGEFQLENEELVATNGKVNYKATGMNKAEFDKILGQDGKIEFFQGEEVLATVQYVKVKKENKLVIIYLDGTIKELNDEDTSIIVEYPENVTSLTIKTSTPIATGDIYFEHQNNIKSSEDYECDIAQIKNMKITTVINEKENITNIPMLEPTTKMTIVSSNQNFSTLQTSKTTLTVKLDDKNPSAKLFDNPTITVKLPEGITGGKLSSPEIVNGNGLEIKNAIANGNTITIELKGKQTAYDLNNVSEGVSIVMDIEGISFSDTLPTHTDKIEVTCNQNKEQTVESCDVNIVSKPGLLMLSKLSNYDETNKVVSTIDNNVKNVEIQSDLEAKEAINTLVLVNNYDEKLTNVQIIGKMENENSTFDTSLAKSIELNAKNAKVYYSNNKDAKAEDDSWKEEFTTAAKACKIVLENEEIDKANSVSIKEYIKIPNNIEVNQVSYLNWSVSYQYKGRNLSEENTFKMTTKKDVLMTNATKTVQNVKAKNGENIPVSLTVTPVIAQNYVHAGQVVTYKIKVTNNGQTDLDNLVLKDIIPENAIYTYKGTYTVDEDTKVIKYIEDNNTKERQWNIEKLKANETQEFDLILTMKTVEAEQELVNKVTIQYDEQSIANESPLLLKPAVLNVNLSTYANDLGITTTYKVNDVVEYRLNIKNTAKTQLKNIKINYPTPEGLIYQQGGKGHYDQFMGYQITEKGTINNNIFEYEISKLEANEELVIVLRYKVGRLQNNYRSEITGVASASIGQEIYQSNLESIISEQAAYKMSLRVDTNGKEVLEKEDTVIYTIEVENIGDARGSFVVKDSIPAQLEVSEVEYGIDAEKEKIMTSSQELEISSLLSKGKKLIVKITTKVREMEAVEETILDVINKATLTSEELVLETNETSIKIRPEVKVVEPDNPNPIEPDNPDNPNPDEPDNPNPDIPEKKYTISGVAWIDENKNGQRDENEKLQDSVVVSLVDKVTGNFVSDENGNKVTATTDTDGKYVFNNIPEGIYIVLFEFDTNTYTVTTYQKEGIEETLNSDVILSTVSINGEQKLAAITDNITLNSNQENVDIGLMMNATFDLSLNKQITKVTVSNSKGTEVTEYEDGETAKIDLVAKYMNTAKVIVNYKFTVKNEGDIIGYVNSLVDNLPSGLEFSSDLNKDWYKGNDGKLYTTALSGKGINPGESVAIELVLTKNMTEESTGVFPNSAELDKISNLENVLEKESALENNQSSATLFISIKTGSVALYTGITLLSIGILTIGTYFIKKKVLDKGI